jgi:HEAT repeat protein
VRLCCLQLLTPSQGQAHCRQPDDAFPVLLRLAEDDPNGQVRSLALSHLIRYRADFVTVLPVLERLATSDSDSHVRRQAARAVASLVQTATLEGDARLRQATRATLERITNE